MDNGTLFYVCGSVLAVSAVVMAFAGLRFKRFPGRVTPFVVLWFVVLIGTTTTFAVLHAKNEEKHEEAALHEATGEAEEEAAEAADKP